MTQSFCRQLRNGSTKIKYLPTLSRIAIGAPLSLNTTQKKFEFSKRPAFSDIKESLHKLITICGLIYDICSDSFIYFLSHEVYWKINLHKWIHSIQFFWHISGVDNVNTRLYQTTNLNKVLSRLQTFYRTIGRPMTVTHFFTIFSKSKR